ncbi:putative Trans-1,2-dihydrobenzene-1,2-diol dehydrogenase [Venustampulla echinocandica]|uniref:D-xylose 1-dehydrogenase (NADP(+), D-xylono-1,5-lactone-forming) n=1 Tax=Venustampulla echinocandica TaxID=2656787 RepID=A0A370TSJ6_9HELO|nr:putative Trans-1,2-dihydrobenzene-1,2-diol dehydrogenase [Venustampulla echinocandica]RDL38507.1 putative Trans-1,2-dihydrobenzene-1,2-diol dehydrogenase [Venustampulla echinocandica]
MAQEPFTVRWGILATGGIATTFAKDLLTNPATRSVNDVRHTIVAAASSSSESRAVEFLKDVGAPTSAKAYGSYHALAQDPNIDVVYVATPHSHHFQNAMLCLTAGKNVLCEKAFTVNAAQARLLVEKAKEKGVFLMEAVWTRYFPLSVKIRELVTSGKIGTVVKVNADLCINGSTDDAEKLSFSDKHRAVNMDLAGGALLDLGIYTLTWVFQILYLCQKAPADGSGKEKPKILAAIDKYHTGADALTSIICHWPKQRTMGIATSSWRVATTPDGEGSPAAGPACRIQGTKGEIQVFGPLYRPTMYRVIMFGGERGVVEEVECPIPKDPKIPGVKGEEELGWGHGMFWEADEVARCLRDGKKQSDLLTWEESIVIMDAMDEVRKQGDLVYPQEIESDVYDEKSPLNGSS